MKMTTRMTTTTSSRRTFIVAGLFVALFGACSAAHAHPGAEAPATSATETTRRATRSSDTRSSSALSRATTTSTTARAGTTIPPPREWPAGPFPVASITTVVTRDSAHRTLRVVVWYPAAGNSPRRSDGPYPLFVWMHGFDADPQYFESYLQAWAAAGYVVAAPTFPGTTDQAGSNAKFDDYVNQPADVTAVLDSLLTSARSPGNVLDGMIDASLVAVGGHSLGAVTAEGLTEESCCVDARVVAAIRISYGDEPFPGSHFLGRSLPQLFIHGDRDATFPVADSISAFNDARGSRFLVVLPGAGHVLFRTDARQEIVRDTTAFLDLVLKHRVGSLALLRHDASVKP